MDFRVDNEVDIRGFEFRAEVRTPREQSEADLGKSQGSWRQLGSRELEANLGHE